MKKKVLTIGFSILLCISCTLTKEEKAQKLIKDHLNKNLSHPKSYESISFSTLDSAFENLDENADPNRQYAKRFAGFKMSHDYRAIDIFNKLHAERQTFFFDKKIDSIIAIRDTIK